MKLKYFKCVYNWQYTYFYNNKRKKKKKKIK